MTRRHGAGSDQERARRPLVGGQARLLRGARDLIADARAPGAVLIAGLDAGGAPHVVTSDALDAPTVGGLAWLVAGTAFLVIRACFRSARSRHRFAAVGGQHWRVVVAGRRATGTQQAADGQR